MKVYDFDVVDIYGEKKSMADYAGKVLLIVNTATECGFTPQYDELQDLYEKYQSEGLEILDFPCNQFGNQAPGTEEEIMSFCDSHFGITFPQFSKVEVNGPNEIPLYSYLKSQKGFEGFDAGHPLTAIVEGVVAQIAPDYKDTPDIKWNFTKFVVDREGNVTARFEPTANIADIDEYVGQLL